jgi:hypothetical protein
MKKAVFLLAIALIGLQSYAQNNANTMPKVRLGTIPRTELVNGKWTSQNVTLAELQANNTLISEGSTCKVIGYSFSILPVGHEFQGPYTVTGSDEFTPQIKKIISGLDNSGGRVFIENIRLNCGGAESTAAPIVFKYK